MNRLIPTIDISSITKEGVKSSRSLKTIKKIKTACTNIGFFVITNHGINEELINSLDAQLENLKKDDTIKGVILTGQEGIFSAG